ncbi:MAG: RNA polymerase sigma factor [Bacteroidales bacterium]
MEQDAKSTTVRGSAEDYAERVALFNELILPLKNMVYKLCINYTMKSEYVEENYNEVLKNLFQYIKTYNPEMKLKTWVHVVCKRHVCQIDKERRCTVVSGRGDKSDIIQVDIEMVDEEHTADEPSWREVSGYTQVGSEEMLEKHLGDGVATALNEIPPLSKRLLLMQYDGMSNKEIADIIYEEGVISRPDAKIVKSKLNSARQQIKKLINRDGERIV